MLQLYEYHTQFDISSNQHIITHNTSKQLQKLQDERIIKLYALADSAALPRYTLTIIDSTDNRSNSADTTHYNTAILIIPQLRQYDYNFCNPVGQLQLVKQHNYNRLIFVTLHSTQTYNSIDIIKNELDSIATHLIPHTVDINRVPYVTIGNESDTLGRSNIYTYTSEYNGTVSIDEYCIDSIYYRQLIFNNNYIQGECRLLYNNQTKQYVADHGYLPSTYQQALLVSLALHNPLQLHDILCIGIGAGNIPSILYHTFNKCHIECIDIDNEIIELAQKYFDLPANTSRMNCSVMNGIDYINSTVQHNTKCSHNNDSTNGGNNNIIKYNAVILNCNSATLEHGLSFPPHPFIEYHTICNILSLLHTNYYVGRPTEIHDTNHCSY